MPFRPRPLPERLVDLPWQTACRDLPTGSFRSRAYDEKQRELTSIRSLGDIRKAISQPYHAPGHSNGYRSENETPPFLERRYRTL
jgi:hypothetical protein